MFIIFLTGALRRGSRRRTAAEPRVARTDIFRRVVGFLNFFYKRQNPSKNEVT